MFDDGLVDGRTMASIYSSLQYKYINDWELKKTPKKFVTPFGWTYCGDEYNPKDEINKERLGLQQIFLMIKNREKTVLVDGVYSVLGLLSYGKKVEVSYKPRMCPECPERKEAKDCKHEEKNKNWHGE